MQIEAILFDFDNTLGNRDGSAYNTYRNMLLEHTDLVKDELLLEAACQDCITWEQSGTYDKNFVIDNLNKKYNLNLDLGNFNTYWETHCGQGYELFDDTIPTLKKLKEKYRLAILSNGDSNGQRSKMVNSDVTSYMEFVMISGDYPYKKPDVRFFQEAINKFNLPTEKILYVGDVFSNDAFGAIRAGMQSISIYTNPYRRHDEKYMVINKISDLCDILL